MRVWMGAREIGALECSALADGGVELEAAEAMVKAAWKDGKGEALVFIDIAAGLIVEGLMMLAESEEAAAGDDASADAEMKRFARAARDAHLRVARRIEKRAA